VKGKIGTTRNMTTNRSMKRIFQRGQIGYCTKTITLPKTKIRFIL
jgi:hypothetical protein